MARLEEFHDSFISIVEGYIRRGGKRTDKAIGELLGYRRQTIAVWRKKHRNFQQAILNPNLRINQIIDEGIERLATEGRVEVIKDGKGEVKEVRELPPTAQDFNVALKAGFGGTVDFNKKEQKIQESETLKLIRQRLLAGKITYLDAVEECEEEGVTVPESWKTREIAKIISMKEAKDLDAVQTVLRLEASGLEVPKLLLLEAQKSLGVVDIWKNDEANGIDLSHLTFEQLLQLKGGN